MTSFAPHLPSRLAFVLAWLTGLAGLWWLAAPVMAPFVVAAVLAYVLHPLATGLRRRLGARVPYWVSVVGVQALALLAMLGVVLLLLPVVTREWPLLREQLPALLDRAEPAARALAGWMGWGDAALNVAEAKVQLRQWLKANGSNWGQWVAPVWASLQVGGGAVLAAVGYVVLVPVVVFFMLHDGERMLAAGLAWVPVRWRAAVQGFVTDSDQVLGEYLRGQMRVMVALALYYALALALFGLKLALPIGVFTGLAVLVPYLGFGLGLVLALLAGLLEMPPAQAVAMVAVVYGLGQLLESVVLTPRWIGERIGLHPLAVIFSLLFFGHWLGFVGVLVALPLSAVLWVGLGRVREAYFSSALYTDAAEP